MIDEEFIPYEEALALKELGFDEPSIAYYIKSTETLCNASYTNDNVEFRKVTLDEIYKDYCLSPTWRQAFKWFRENYNIDAAVYPVRFKNSIEEIETSDLDYSYMIIIRGITQFISEDEEFNTHEEAELACLRAVIEIAKRKDNGE